MNLTIKRKESGVGAIHDLRSDRIDRVINFKGNKYAVVLSAYYGGIGYTTHLTADAAIKQSRIDSDYSHQIIDCVGNYMEIYGDELVAIGDNVNF